jgi:hypothetical protein
MKIQKAMAITPYDLEAMAIDYLQYESYTKPEYLSNKIDYLLAGFVFVLQDHTLSSPEQATALIFLDSLLRLKIGFKQAKGVCCG